MRSYSLSRLNRLDCASSFDRCFCCRCSLTCLASFSSFKSQRIRRRPWVLRRGRRFPPVLEGPADSTCLPLIVQHRTDSAVMHTAHHRITGMQGAFSLPVLWQWSASARVDFGFHHMTAGQLIRIGLEFQGLPPEADIISSSSSMPFGLLWPRRSHKWYPRPSLQVSGRDFGKFPLNLIGIGILFVDFVDGDDNRVHLAMLWND